MFMRRNREGAGLPAPQGGIELFFYLLTTYFWRLATINLVFLLSCIPIITIPAALTALNRVCIKLVREKNVLFWEEYRDEFKRSFLKSIPMGAFFLWLLFIAYYLLSLGLTNAQSIFGLLFTGLGMCIAVFSVGWSCYGFVLMAALDQSLSVLLKNARLLMMAGAKYTLAIFGVLFAAFLLQFILFPFGGILMFAGWFAVIQFAICALVNIPMEEYIIAPYERGA